MTTLAALVAATPAAARGVATRVPASVGVWRVVVEIADPGAGSGVVWHDITCDVMGWQNVRGADQYAGRYRASVTDIELFADDDRLAPWNDDTSPQFGVHVPLGPGLIIRAGMIRVSGGTVVEWLPRFTNRVERWGDASYAQGQVRRYPIIARDLMTAMVDVPIPATTPQNWSDRVNTILIESAWPFGATVYGALFETGPVDVLTIPARPAQSSALTELQQTLDPAGLVYYTDRTGKLIIRPAVWDTFHTSEFAGGATGTPLPPVDYVHFTYLACDADALVEWADYVIDSPTPFGFDKAEDGVINHVIRVGPGGTFDDDNPVSIQRYDRKTDQASWIADNDQAAQDLLDYRADATIEAHPLDTHVDADGFLPGPVGLDYLDGVAILHQTAPGRGTANGSGWLRQYTERCTPRGTDDTWWDLTFVVDIVTVVTEDSLLPVENLTLVDVTDTSAEFSWTNPTQTVTPTNTQIRMLNPASLWATVDYPILGTTWNGLDPSTGYEFQVRLIRVVDGVITHYSPARSLSFTTLGAEIPDVDVDDDGDTHVDFPPPDPGCTLEWRLQESADSTTWTTVLTGSITSAPWTVDIPDYAYVGTKLYRVCSREVCGGVPGAYVCSNLYVGLCTDPPALASGPPFNDPDLLFYFPAVCPPDTLVEALSEDVATKGFQYDGFVTDGDGNVVLKSKLAGIVAYALNPTRPFDETIAGLVDDTTLACKVLVMHKPDLPVILFNAAGLTIEARSSGANWRVRGIANEIGTATFIQGASVLNFGAWYDLAITHDVATGDLRLYIDGIQEVAALGTVGVRRNPGYYQVGAPEASLITNCAVWDRVLAAAELPGFAALPPTVDIDREVGQADPTTDAAIQFTATFSEPVTGFATGDVTLAGTAGATTVTVLAVGSSTTVYTITVTGMGIAGGTVVVSIPAGVCTSIASGVGNAASTHTDNSVVWTGPCTAVLNEPFNNLTAWTVAGSASIVAGGRTGNAVQINSGSSQTISYNLGGNENAYVTIGAAFKFATAPSTQDFLQFRSDSGATLHTRLQFGGGRQIQVFTQSTQHGATSSVLTLNTWYYIEVQIRLHDTLGSVTARINNTVFATASNVDTKNAGTKTVIDQIRIASTGSISPWFVDDLYITTGSGCSFQGDHTIP